jgi:hypothetical protein
MVKIYIRGWNRSRAWASYGGRQKRQLLYLLRLAAPSSRLTERKRLASAILHREPLEFQLPNEKIRNVVDFLRSIGAELAIDDNTALRDCPP